MFSAARRQNFRFLLIIAAELLLLHAHVAAGVFFTAAGAKAVGALPKAWNKRYERGLERRLLTAWTKGRQLFNTANQWTRSNSFHGCQTKRAAKKKIKDVILLIKGIFEAAMSASGTTVPKQGHFEDVFYERIAAPGFPKSSYGQNLAACVWRYGNLVRGVERMPLLSRPSVDSKKRPREDGQFVRDEKPIELFPVTESGRLTACGTGTARGIAKITGDTYAKLLKSPELQRYRIKQIGAAVQVTWKAGRPRVANPFKQKRLAKALEEALSHQLCEWAKGGYTEVLNRPKTIVAGVK